MSIMSFENQKQSLIQADQPFWENEEEENGEAATAKGKQPAEATLDMDKEIR